MIAIVLRPHEIQVCNNQAGGPGTSVNEPYCVVVTTPPY